MFIFKRNLVSPLESDAVAAGLPFCYLELARSLNLLLPGRYGPNPARQIPQSR
jgi:hypothetical protein